MVFHMVVVTLYALPKPHQGVLDGTLTPKGTDLILKFNQQNLKTNPVVHGYLQISGFWQYWDMFAPDPSQADIYVSCEVTFFDGTKKPFAYPRIYLLPIPQKYIYERHRKFYERVNDDKNAFLWPSFAQYIAVQSATDPKNPPVKVELTRHWRDVPRHNHARGADPPYMQYTYYRYAVDKTMLFEARGWKLGRP